MPIVKEEPTRDVLEALESRVYSLCEDAVWKYGVDPDAVLNSVALTLVNLQAASGMPESPGVRDAMIPLNRDWGGLPHVINPHLYER